MPAQPPSLVQPAAAPITIPLPAGDTPLEVHSAAAGIAPLASSSTMHLAGTLEGSGKSVACLVDSGASGNFIDIAVARAAGVELSPSGRVVRLADGTERPVDGVARVTLALHTDEGVPIKYTVDLCVTELKGFDVILGMPWLSNTNPSVDWQARSLRAQRSDGSWAHLTRVETDHEGQQQRRAPVKCAAIKLNKWSKLMKQRDLSDFALMVVRPAIAGRRSALHLAATQTATAEADDKPRDPRLVKLLDEFKDVLPAELPPGLPPDRGVAHRIETVADAKPHAPPLRRYSPAEDAEIRKQVSLLLDRGHLRESVSPWGAMVLLARKKDGSLRFCVDYRALNNQTVKNRYALPHADQCFDRAQGCSVFSKLDLHSGFWQILLDEGSAHLTAFRTHFGHYEYTVLPMGLCNAPATFQALMHKVLRKELDQFALAFLDDIFVFSHSVEEHLGHLRTVLTRMRENRLYLKPSKCEWMKDEVEFLGHRIGRDGLTVDPHKVDAIKQWPVPTDVSALRSFLGLANYYRRFIRCYSDLALPLTNLTGDVEWKWGEVEQKAFDALKGHLSTTPVLALADTTKPFVIHTDASGFAVGAVLMQDQGRGLQPVSFISQKMSAAERNYAPHEQELLALVYACGLWRHYLEGGQPFTLLSDHKTLRHFATQPNLSPRQVRWYDKLTPFDFEIKYIEGVKNVVADALSRREDHFAGQGFSLDQLLRRAKVTGTTSKTDYLAALRFLEGDGSKPEAALPFLRLAAMAVTGPQGPASTPREAGVELAALRLAALQAASADSAAVVARRAAQDAARTNVPLAADRPPVNKKGEVVMPSQRCTADKRDGTQCKGWTRHGEFCWGHLAMYGGLRIKDSTIADAGKGLYANRDFAKGEVVAHYTGDIVPESYDDVDTGSHQSRYLLSLTRSTLIDAARTNTAPGRMVNDPRGSGKKQNVSFCCDQRNKTVTLKATRAIKKGAELLVSYGRAYWTAARSGLKAQAAGDRPPMAIKRKGQQRGVAHVPVEGAVVRGSRESPIELGTAATRARGSATGAPSTTSRTGPPTAADSTLARHASWLSEVRARAQEDAAYTALLAQPPTEYSVRDGLLWRGGALVLPATEDGKLRTTAMAECHDTLTGGHFGRIKTLQAVRGRFHWAGLAGDVERYVRSCQTCQAVKPVNRKTAGLLMPLPVPDKVDSHWTMDFVTGFPLTARGFDAVQVHVSRGGHVVRLAAARKDDTAATVLQRFIESVVRNHGVPESVLTDRDPRLVSLGAKGFWQALWARLGTQLPRSTAFHPQTDGATEKMNSTLITWLRAFVGRQSSDWDEQLPLAELAINSAPVASLGDRSPFELYIGRNPAHAVDRVLTGDAPSLAAEQAAADVPAAEQRLERMRAAWTAARGDLLAAQRRMAQQADRHRRDVTFKVGDMVWLSTHDLTFKDERARKLAPLFCGPFPVTEVVNKNAYRLALPAHFTIHPVINVSRLRAFVDDRAAFPDRPATLARPPPDAVDSNGQGTYEVERILAHRGAGANARYLVLWKGYAYEDASWENASNIVGAPDALDEYRRLQRRLPQRQRGAAQLSALDWATGVANGVTPPAARRVGVHA
jgi:hypothetical protein